MNVPQLKRAQLIAVSLAAIFAFWNLYDEFWILQSWEGVLGAFAFWMLPVAIATLATRRASHPPSIRSGFVITAALTGLYFIYAINGSSQDRGAQGAEHMHIILVPILLTFGVTLAVFAMALLSIRDRRRERKRNA